MRLMVLTAWYLPTQNAPSVRMSQLVGAFAEEERVEHITVLVYKPEQKTEHCRREVKLAENVTAVYYGTRPSAGILQRLSSLAPFTLACWTAFAIREARRASPDVILATIPPRFNPAIAAYFTSVLRHLPFCIDIRDFWEGSYQRSLRKRRSFREALAGLVKRVMTRLFLRACRKALLISVVYESIGEYLAEHCGIRTPTIWIPNGVNFAEQEKIASAFDKREVLLKNGIPYSQDSRYVIFIGKVGEYYKPEVLLKPLKRLRENGRNVAYIIIGEGASRQVIEEMATGADLNDAVFLLGEIDHSRVLELLLASDAGFFPLGNDHPYPGCDLGVKVLEYIACKLPILSIAGDKSAVAGLVIGHELGIALKWDEVEQLEEAMVKLLDRSEDYVRNIERYHPVFAREFDRSRSNHRLFQELWKRWKGSNQITERA